MSQICQACKQGKATVHVTDLFPNKRERNLCAECAEKERVIVKQPTHTAAILQEFIKHKASLGEGDGASCPQCGTTFREFQLRGLLGCPNDYDVFRPLLSPLIERAHEGAGQHVGKRPRGVDADTRRHAGLSRLRRELRDALERENYELAARVRDQIRQLETA
jgi:protein arginine kinase activator